MGADLLERSLLERICVRTSLLVKGESENQGSGFIIKSKDLFYIVTAHHCIYGDGEDGEYQDITPDNIHIEHQKEYYNSPFTRIEVEDIIDRNKQQDWALLRIANPDLTVDFSKIKLGIPTQKNIDVTFCGYQHVYPDSFRSFPAELLSLAPGQFKITLKGKSFSQGSEEGSYIAKGLSGSGVGVEYKDTLYLIGLLKSVIGSEALNDDIDCCPVSCLSASLKEPIVNVPQIDPRPSDTIVERADRTTEPVDDDRSSIEEISEVDTYTDEKTGLEMIRIPEGEFIFGEDNRREYLLEYWISKTPVTNALYLRFVSEKGHDSPENGEGELLELGDPDIAKHPVVWVSWEDAKAYADWAGMDLPSEKEWEKAARGTDGRLYPWGKEWIGGYCNTNDAGIGKTTPVGKYSPRGDSPYGCVDMAGNVWEWTESWYDDYKKKRVLRGGSWSFNQDDARAAFRYLNNPRHRNDSYGFRVVRRPRSMQ